MNIEELQANYRAVAPLAQAFLAEFMHQFGALVSKADIKLGVPLEGRVKEWSSIATKLERKALQADNCKALGDLIGIRAITLFMRDVTALCRLVEKTFPIKEREDKAIPLDNSQFGYMSKHFVVGLPRAWRKVPAFSSDDFLVEIQVRTLSQHIWAAASHHLQYKKEADVPAKVSRSIHRVAALLETVDLEFERVLEEQAQYTKSAHAVDASTPLDVDNLRLLLEQSFPAENRGEHEVYSDVLTDLQAFGISTVEALRALVSKNRDAALAADKMHVEIQRKSAGRLGRTVSERVKRGAFFTHSGLARQLLSQEFKQKWEAYSMAQASKRDKTHYGKVNVIMEPPKNQLPVS